jgi:hypothetical protein
MQVAEGTTGQLRRISSYGMSELSVMPDIEYETHCPANGWSMNFIWKQAYSPPPGSEGLEKIRGAYDYGEPLSPSPHSWCPGDWIVTPDGKIVLVSAR